MCIPVLQSICVCREIERVKKKINYKGIIEKGEENGVEIE